MIFHKQSMSGNLSTTLIISGVLLAVGLAFLFVFLPAFSRSETRLRLGDGIFRIDIASNKSTREKGFSGQSEIAVDQALLMIFPSEDRWGIWMKDMHFPIDIVWLNKDKKVVHIVKNAPVDNPTKIYGPATPALYVIELPAGTTNNKSITLNKTAIFQVDTVGQK